MIEGVVHTKKVVLPGSPIEYSIVFEKRDQFLFIKQWPAEMTAEQREIVLRAFCTLPGFMGCID